MRPLLLRALLLLAAAISCLHTTRGQSGDGMLSFDSSGRLKPLELSRRVVTVKGGPVCAVSDCHHSSVLIAVASAQRRGLLQQSHVSKVHFLDGETLLAVSGVLPEARPVVDLARKLSLDHRQLFARAIPVNILATNMARTLHSSTIDSIQRPPAVACVLCGLDDRDQCAIYTVECDGSFHCWKAVAVGKDADDMMKVLSSAFGDGISDDSLCARWDKSILRPFFGCTIGSASATNADKDTDTAAPERDVEVYSLQSFRPSHHSDQPIPSSHAPQTARVWRWRAIKVKGLPAKN